MRLQRRRGRRRGAHGRAHGGRVRHGGVERRGRVALEPGSQKTMWRIAPGTGKSPLDDGRAVPDGVVRGDLALARRVATIHELRRVEGLAV